ncbi:hypothetical protein BJ508DRAFT_415848 [Ascobolus immersus RN42]|uniref:Uncharacterized protein n=1 Tax=Ascobolus immersus RN42 TaxID=1160509 RepID=A0A3N4I650_ASCIM|nr:hypothetical protein BJ508DRAFT_415848 [Ascobolus immersus RN42]
MSTRRTERRVKVRPSVEWLSAFSNSPADWVWGYAVLRTDYSHESPAEWNSIIEKIRGFLHQEVDFEHKRAQPLKYLPSSARDEYRAAKRGGNPNPPVPQLDRAPSEEVKNRLRLTVFEDREALENGTVEQAREYFKGLCDAGRIERGLVQRGFLLVDKETSISILASLDGPPEQGLNAGVGFVKFVERQPRSSPRAPKYEGWMKVKLHCLWYFMKDLEMWPEGAWMIAPPVREDGSMREYYGNGYVAGGEWDSDLGG